MNCKTCCLVGAFLSAVIAVGIYHLLETEYPSPVIPEIWWGKGDRTEEDPSITSVKVNISANQLNDLKQRLDAGRFQESLDDGDFTYGFQTEYLIEVVNYWKTKYDWRKQEAVLNSFPQFMTNIEGIKIHFFHVKPNGNGNKKTFPILLLHGWPSSVWEFYKVLPILTDSSQDVVFEVICPSMPGYGFSQAASKRGMDLSQIARLYQLLMKRLGYERFYVQGGDWGSGIATIMAQAYPDKIIGVHLNLIAPGAFPKTLIKMAVGEILPWLIYDAEDREHMRAISEQIKFLLGEMGYAYIQSTKPDTVGAALTDSPIGLAAYILEKYSVWTDRESRVTKDGELTKKFTLDELLTNVMIYWTNRNIVSSVRLYKEVLLSEVDNAWDLVLVKAPLAVASFPQEIMMLPRSLVADRYKDIVQYTTLPRGGHFPALEEPHLLCNDIRNFVRKVQSREKEN